MFKYLLFDLDGTVTDSAPGITRCARYALNHFGIAADDLEELKKFIGPPLYESFEKYYGFSREDSLAAVAKYRERYTDIGIFENSVYDGIPQLLKELKSAGKIIVLATAKPLPFAKRILEHYDLERYFDYVFGIDFNGPLTNKSEVIAYALKNIGICSFEDAVMIGDRDNDILGAIDNDISSVGVLYGYGSRGELEGAGASYIAENICDLKKLLL